MIKGKPFVKWAGGKRQIIDKLKQYIPDEFNTYYEDNVKVLLTNGINQLDTTISDIEKKQINEKQIEIEEFIKEHILSNHLESVVDVIDVIEYANLKINLSTSIKSLISLSAHSLTSTPTKYATLSTIFSILKTTSFPWEILVTKSPVLNIFITQIIICKKN